MRARRFAVAVAVTLLPVQSMAGYMNNYAAWKQGSPEEQAIYLLGALDGWLQIGQKSDPENLKVRRAGMLSCFDKLGFNGGLAVDLVNTHYKDYPVDWHYGPAAVLYYAINGMCLPEINEERAKVGLPALIRLPAQLSADTP